MADMKTLLPIALVSCLLLAACVEKREMMTDHSAGSKKSMTISSVLTGSTMLYTNDTYGFSFEYPSDWQLIQKRDGYAIFRPIESGTGSAKSSLAIWSGPNIAHDGGGDTMCGKGTVVIAGRTVESQTYCGLHYWDTGEEVSPDFREITTGFSQNNIQYGFEFSMEDPSAYHNEQDVFDKVMASFKLKN